MRPLCRVPQTPHLTSTEALRGLRSCVRLTPPIGCQALPTLGSSELDEVANSFPLPGVVLAKRHPKQRTR